MIKIGSCKRRIWLQRLNATQVDTQDKLTDQVYHYDVTDKVFEKASRYEDRRIEKEESKTFAGTKKTPRREDVSL